MPAIRIVGFSGLVPKLSSRLLAENQAQIASNVTLWSGDIEPLRAPESVYISSKVGPLLSAFRLSTATGDVWLAWSEDVNAVRGPIASDTSQRTYFTGQGEPRVTDAAMAVTGFGDNYPALARVLGIPKPITAPTVGSVGGGAAQTRSYVFTFVSKTTLPNGAVLDEEGPPSNQTTVVGNEGGTWTISNIEAVIPNSGTITAVENNQPSAGFVRVTLNTTKNLRQFERIVFAGVTGMTSLNSTFRIESVDSSNRVVVSLSTAQAYTGGGSWARDAAHHTTGMVKRIYRADAAGTFRMVAEISLATTSVVDPITDSALPSMGELVSTSWLQPPADMHSLISLPNGVFAGISGNQLCLSEPYQPHAWPPEYRKVADYDGVSLGNIGTMVVMTTLGPHYIATGADPATVTMSASQGRPMPCLAKRSTVSSEIGVMWATHDGIALQTQSGSSLFTESLFENRHWKPLNPASMFAAVHDGRYICGLQREGSDVREMMILDPGDHAFLVTSTVNADGLYSDIRSGILYVLRDSTVSEWDPEDGIRLSGDWMSKEHVIAKPVNLAAAKIDFETTLTEAESQAAEAAFNAIVAENIALLAGIGYIGGAVNDGVVNGFGVNDSPLNSVPKQAFDVIFFYLYSGEDILFSRRVTSSVAFRLPDGFKLDAYAIRVTSNVRRIRAVVFGTSMKELEQA